MVGLIGLLPFSFSLHSFIKDTNHMLWKRYFKAGVQTDFLTVLVTTYNIAVADLATEVLGKEHDVAGKGPGSPEMFLTL